MRCKNCGSKATPGRYCSGCGMLQPPRVAKGLKVAVTVLSVLAVLLLSAVGYVLLKLEPERKAANAPVATLAELRDTDDAPVRELPQNVQEKQEQPAQEPAAGEPEADVQEDAALMPEAPESEAQTVDSEVKAIRAEYNAIEEKRTAGQYEKTLLRQSAYGYTDDGEPVCIILRSGADGLDFERSYYFNGGMLRFLRQRMRAGCISKTTCYCGCAMPRTRVRPRNMSITTAPVAKNTMRGAISR